MTPDQIADLRRRRYNGTVVAVRRAHSDLMVLRVRPDFPRPVHRAGQYCTLGLGMWEPRFPGCQEEERKPGDEARVVRRAYSLSCSVLGDDGSLLDLDATDWLEFYIVLVRETEDPARAPGLTPRLFMLREGDRLQIGERITGHFTLEGVKPTDAVVFLSTGTGEAPHNYMLWELLKGAHHGPIAAACCVRYRRDLGYLAVHERLVRDFPSYKYIPLTTREPEAAGKKVYIQDLITAGHLEDRLGRPLDPEATHVYLCGNPKMIGVPVKDPATSERRYPRPTGVVEILETRFGFTADNPAARVRGNVHFEEYW
ncbi:MAG TPA: ferredoxin--NADP reductase [Gemmataceae bacterium]|nr:ferredoxin--NADP reductase [Gemmataceae bacterium]